MMKQNPMRPSDSPFTTIQNFSARFPEFTKGALKWLIFNKREELIKQNVIRFWGKKILIHQDNFFIYIMEDGTKSIR
jgi:hypothetical protein